MDWTREKTILLISEYRKRRGLWDMTHEDYRKKEVKRDLLQEVSEAIDEGSVPVLEIEKKFHTLRTQFHREINRMKRNEPYNSKWFAFKHLEFLSSPKACRNSKGSIKAKEETVKYIIREAPETVANTSASQPQSGTTITTEFLTIHRKPSVSYNQKNSLKFDSEARRARDLEKLIEETTKDVEDQHEDTKKKFFIKEITVPAVAQQHNHSYTSSGSTTEIIEHDHHQLQHDDHDNQDEEIETEDMETSIDGENINFHHATPHRIPATSIIKIQPRRELEETYYEEEQHHETTQPPAKQQRLGYFELGSLSPVKQQQQPQQPQQQQQQQQNRGLDEFTTYGEYVSNEMRSITNREILQTLKHKINTALFEASMSELQK